MGRVNPFINSSEISQSESNPIINGLTQPDLYNPIINGSDRVVNGSDQPVYGINEL